MLTSLCGKSFIPERINHSCWTCFNVLIVLKRRCCFNQPPLQLAGWSHGEMCARACAQHTETKSREALIDTSLKCSVSRTCCSEYWVKTLSKLLMSHDALSSCQQTNSWLCRFKSTWKCFNWCKSTAVLCRGISFITQESCSTTQLI